MVRQYPPPLLVHQELVRDLRAIQHRMVTDQDARERLGTLLQSALQLEFATVPIYLSAAFSIQTGNDEIRELILRVAKEEMLHMTVVANLMNAIGIAPDITGAVPDYPYDLNVLDPPFRLDLQSFSLELVEKLFRHIETPEEPVDFSPPGNAEPPETIGQFYEDIIDLMKNDTIPDLFKNAERDSYKQIEVAPNFRPIQYASNQDSHHYPLKENINFIISDKESAVRHLTWVVSEGEGASPFNPLDAEGIPGHYYRFESILEGKYLVKDDNAELKYSFSGGDLPFSPAGVHEFDMNAKVENYADHDRVELHMNRFNGQYTEMIDHLQAAFNCPSPDQEQQAKDAYDRAVDVMRSMPNTAAAIIRAAENSGIKAGIPFQYLPGQSPL